MRRAERTGGATREQRCDRGFSLVEIVITVALMSIVIVPVVNAVISTVRASTRNGVAAEVETVLQNAADRVNRAPKRCDYTVYVQAAAQAKGWAASNATLVESHYQPGATPAQTGSWKAGGCPGSTRPDLLVQRVEISVVSPDGGSRRTIEVIKSDV